jgi:glycosyltransferase involved in cell wall biosynthesis
MKKLKQLLVISSYPPKGVIHHSSVIGGASYTKNTLHALVDEIKSRKETPRITVLAEKDSQFFAERNTVESKRSRKISKPSTPLHSAQSIYFDHGITVKRIWRPNSVWTFPVLLKEILLHHRRTTDIFIGFEITMFGTNALSLLPFLPFMLVLKLLRKRTTIVFHQVFGDMNAVAGHMNRKPGIATKLMNLQMKLFYTMLLPLIHKAIVFDDLLARRLSGFGGQHKIQVIPHAVEAIPEALAKEQARKKLGIANSEFVLLAFGFLAWYKGSDWLVNVWKGTKVLRYKGAEVRLILAGGANPNRIRLGFYRDYLANITAAAKQHSVQVTGFVPQEQMAAYFAAANIIVFPYRTVFAASGPLSLAFSFGKPVLLSKNMEELLMTADIKNELAAANLQPDALTFTLTNSFPNRIEKIKSDKQLMRQFTMFSRKMKKVRSWQHIRKQYYDLLSVQD